MLNWLLLIVCIIIALFVFVELYTGSDRKIKTWSLWKSFWLLFINRNSTHLAYYKFLINNHITGFFSLWFGTTRLFLATDPDAAQWLLSQKETHVKKLKNRGHERFSYSISASTGDDWRRQRLVYNPVFKTEAYRGYFSEFLSCTEKCMSILERNGSSEDVNFITILSSFTLDVLGKSIFGYDFGSMDNKLDKYYEAYKMIFSTLFHRATNKQKHALEMLDELFYKMMEKAPKSARTNILSNMVDALKSESANGATMSENELISNMYTLFIAGHETTATALSWLVYELAMHPEIQEKMVKEIRNVVGNSVPTFEDLDKLEYVDNVITENLRIHPPVIAIPSREVVTDIQYNDQVIPKGSRIGLCIYNIHHHPAFWDKPFEFNPDRFSHTENIEKRHKFSYLPFSLGPRMCIGNNFSLIEQRLFIARLLQNFELLPPKNHVNNGKMIKSIAGALAPPLTSWVALKRRNNQ